jgi:hypothetical protein
LWSTQPADSPPRLAPTMATDSAGTLAAITAEGGRFNTTERGFKPLRRLGEARSRAVERRAAVGGRCVGGC